MKFLFKIIICLIWIGCNSDNNIDKDAENFDDYSFNILIEGEGNFGIGYYFYIGEVKYYEKINRWFVFYPESFDQQEELMPTLTYRKTNPSPIDWRYVNFPYRLIKKANSDTLTLIKNNKKYFFHKEKTGL